MQTNLKMYKTRLQTLKASLDSDVGNMKDITADIKKYEDKVKYVETSILAQSAVAKKVWRGAAGQASLPSKAT